MRGIRVFVVMMITAMVRASGDACPLCYGASDSPMTAGMNAAIIVMLGITGVVLALFACGFFLMYRRANRLKNEDSSHFYVNEEGILKAKKEEGVVAWNNF